MKIDSVIFDMDGVIVDVSKSYRETIRQTASYFLKREVKKVEVDRIKSKVGVNNDWDATYALINDKNISFDEVKDYFQSKYLGDGKTEGLILNEKLLISKVQLQKLKTRYNKLGIATGRPREEAQFVILSNRLGGIFDCIVALEDVKREKPFPDSIIKVIDLLKLQNAVYIGDSSSDVLAAESAGIPSIYIGKEKLGTMRFPRVSAAVKYLLQKQLWKE